MRRVISIFMLTLIFVSLSVFAFDIKPAKSSGTIYIRADGSVDPSSANIASLDNVTYTFIDNNYDEIVVERSNIIIDGSGYTVSGSGTGTGFKITSIYCVTVENTNIENFTIGILLNQVSYNIINGNNITSWHGIYIEWGSNNTICGNNITDNESNGILIEDSSNNEICGNNITDNESNGIIIADSSNNRICENNIMNNGGDGILLSNSPFNTISGNNITNNYDGGISIYAAPYGLSNNNAINRNNITNNYSGILMASSINNTVNGNNITNNYCGVWLESSSGNRFYHNSFINNIEQVYFYYFGYASVWDDGYPSGGNFWDDYTGMDADGDGIGDTPYIIDEENVDKFPLMSPFVPSIGDINGDRLVNAADAIQLGLSFGLKKDDPDWNPNADLNDDGYVNAKDVVILGRHFNQE